MEFKGKYMVTASPDAVWNGLHDANLLLAAIPGCEAVDRLSATDFRVRAAITLGAVEAHFRSTFQLREIASSDSAARTLIVKGDGQGGNAGYARGELHMRLFACAGGTLVEFDARATGGGGLAQAAGAQTEGAAKAFADAFFEKFAQLMARESESLPPPDASKRVRSLPAKSEEDLAPQIWVAGLIGIIVILLIVFSIVL